MRKEIRALGYKRVEVELEEVTSSKHIQIHQDGFGLSYPVLKVSFKEGEYVTVKGDSEIFTSTNFISVRPGDNIVQVELTHSVEYSYDWRLLINGIKADEEIFLFLPEEGKWYKLIKAYLPK